METSAPTKAKTLIRLHQLFSLAQEICTQTEHEVNFLARDPVNRVHSKAYSLAVRYRTQDGATGGGTAEESVLADKDVMPTFLTAEAVDFLRHYAPNEAWIWRLIRGACLRSQEFPLPLAPLIHTADEFRNARSMLPGDLTVDIENLNQYQLAIWLACGIVLIDRDNKEIVRNPLFPKIP